MLWYTDGWVRIWDKLQESMDPCYLLSMIQTSDAVMVQGIFSWHIHLHDTVYNSEECYLTESVRRKRKAVWKQKEVQTGKLGPEWVTSS